MITDLKVYKENVCALGEYLMKKEKKHQRLFTDILDRFAQESHCCRRKVACLAVKDNRIIATGINGTPAGCENCDDHFEGWDLNSEEFKNVHHEWSVLNEVHAEQALLSFAARNGICLDGCDIYCSLAPCKSCMLLLASLHPKRIFYKDEYDKSDVLYIREFFDKMNIEFIKLEGEENE